MSEDNGVVAGHGNCCCDHCLEQSRIRLERKALARQSSGVGEEEIREVLEPFAAKATLVEQARETWKPSLGPLGGDYTVSVKLSHCRHARALLERLTR
jgi:hypothetical protein